MLGVTKIATKIGNVLYCILININSIQEDLVNNIDGNKIRNFKVEKYKTLFPSLLGIDDFIKCEKKEKKERKEIKIEVISQESKVPPWCS